MTSPTFPPTEEGFRDAVARSRRRRTRRQAVAASASGTALAVAAVLVLNGQAASPDSLRQQQPFGPAGAPSSPPRPDATPSPDAGRAPAPLQESAPGGSAGRPQQPVPVASPGAREATAEASGLPSPRHSGHLVSTPTRLTITSYEPNAPCADTSGRAATGWCLQTDPPRSGISGRPVDLALSLCRLPGFGAAAASFPSTAEAGYALQERSGGATLWDHARQHPGRPGRHERQVQAGKCLTWTVTWTNRDDRGEPVAPGSYELRLSVLADNTSGPNTVVTQTYAYDVEAAP